MHIQGRTTLLDHYPYTPLGRYLNGCPSCHTEKKRKKKVKNQEGTAQRSQIRSGETEQNWKIKGPSQAGVCT